MKRLVLGATVLVLALSACGGSDRAPINSLILPVHVRTLPAPLARRIAAQARGTARSLGDRSVTTALVYGPDSRYALVKASSGDLVQKLPQERKGYYLIVLHGHFVCGGCTGPVAGAKPARGKVATIVWSPKAGQTDFGIGKRSVPLVRLTAPAVVSLSG
jgi:hypothetical protein